MVFECAHLCVCVCVCVCGVCVCVCICLFVLCPLLFHSRKMGMTRALSSEFLNIQVVFTD